MPDLRPTCERRDTDPPPGAAAMIRGLDRAFRPDRARGVFGETRPNRAGALVRRPVRPAAALRVPGAAGCDAGRAA